MASHHSFEVAHAVRFGLAEAVMIAALRKVIDENHYRGRNWREGKTWHSDSYAELRTFAPYWTVSQIRRSIDSLVKQGVLLKKQFLIRQGDARNWYAFSEEIP